MKKHGNMSEINLTFRKVKNRFTHYEAWIDDKLLLATGSTKVEAAQNAVTEIHRLSNLVELIASNTRNETP